MSPTSTVRRVRGTDASRGQALVEFSLTVLVFIMLLVGIFDVGRAVFMYNSVSQAARDIARVTSVHPGSTLGDSTETQAVIDQHLGLLPGLQDPTFSCVDIDGSAVAGECLPGKWVRVEVIAEYHPATPLFSMLEMDLGSTSSVQIP